MLKQPTPNDICAMESPPSLHEPYGTSRGLAAQADGHLQGLAGSSCSDGPCADANRRTTFPPSLHHNGHNLPIPEQYPEVIESYGIEDVACDESHALPALR